MDEEANPDRILEGKLKYGYMDVRENLEGYH
jgi:hypothetical protein